MHETILKLLQTVENLEKRIELLEKASRANTDEITAINNSMVHAMMQRIIMSKQLERVMGAQFGRNYWQETRSPAPSAQTAEENSEVSDVKNKECAGFSPEDDSPDTRTVSPAATPVSEPEKSDRTFPAQSDVPVHPQVELFLESVRDTSRQTCRDEFYSLVAGLLVETAKRSILSK